MDIKNENPLSLDDVLLALKNLSGKINNEDMMRAAMMIGAPGNPMGLHNIKRYLKGDITGQKKHADMQARKLLEIFLICAEGTAQREKFIDDRLQSLQIAA